MIRINTATISLIIAIIALLDSIRNNIVSFRRNRHSNTAIAIKEFSNKISQFNKISSTNTPLSANVNIKVIKKSLPNLKDIYRHITKANFINNKDSNLNLVGHKLYFLLFKLLLV